MQIYTTIALSLIFLIPTCIIYDVEILYSIVINSCFLLFHNALAGQQSTMAANKSSSLVVIGGWLGCKPKHLKSYERVYNSLGFDSLCLIASPLCVIDAVLSHQNSSRERIEIPSFKLWTGSSNSSDDALYPNCDTKMQALAWKVLGDIHNSQADEFIYHCFSNAGCFLWESMCKILQLKDSKHCDSEISVVLERLHGKCKGVVFDSCPAWFGTKLGPSKLWQALQYCSEEEKQRVRSTFGDRIDTVDKNMVNRNLKYFENLATCPFDIPQLYLYSKNDDLSRHEHISKMIDIRRLRQESPVLKQQWETSIHCRHLLEHSDDYQEALKIFIQHLNDSVKARL